MPFKLSSIAVLLSVVIAPAVGRAAEITAKEPALSEMSKWSVGDTQREAAFLALVAVDWSQTSDAMRRPFTHEGNPILGDHPSQGQINTYMLAASLGHVGAAYILPSPWRKYFQYTTIGFEGLVVGANYFTLQQSF